VMTRKSSVEIVENFWREVWQARNPRAVDGLVTGGAECTGDAESSIRQIEIEVAVARLSAAGGRRRRVGWISLTPA
jgi:hypothetical protein